MISTYEKFIHVKATCKLKLEFCVRLFGNIPHFKYLSSDISKDPVFRGIGSIHKVTSQWWLL